MGSSGSRYCFFSVDTSDYAQFPNLGTEEVICAESPLPQQQPNRTRFGTNDSHDDDVVDGPDVAQPWLLNARNDTNSDIDGPPREFDEEEVAGFWTDCCSGEGLRDRFPSRHMALTAARRHSAAGDFHKAVAAYLQAINIASGASPAGAIASSNGISSFAVNAAHLSEEAAIYDELGQLYFEHNIHDKALLFFERSTWMDKGNVDYWHRRGVVYQVEAEWHKALKCFQKCLTYDSSFIPALFHLGVLNRKLGKYMDALINLNNLLVLDPVHTEALVLASECYEKLGVPEEALACMNKVVKLDPTYFAARRMAEKLAQQVRQPTNQQTVFARNVDGDNMIVGGNVGYKREEDSFQRLPFPWEAAGQRNANGASKNIELMLK